MSYDPRSAGALCDQCPLNGQVVVPPEGPQDAVVAIVGEGPGFKEVQKRKPFIGPSGLLLNEILQTVGLDREDVLVTNAVLCRAEVPDENVRPQKKFDIPTYMAWIRKENNRRKKEAKASGVVPNLISDPFLCCSQRLWNELWWLERNARNAGLPNGAVVIPVGNKALEMTTGKTGILKWRGSPLQPIGQNQ